MSLTPNSWISLQKETPILDTLGFLADRGNAPFYAPGHKQGGGISAKIEEIFGKSLFKLDLPELPELDNLFSPQGVIEKAQVLAANAFGAEKTWFLINGSTCGIVASILAICNSGDKVILPRNCHQSAIAGLILSGAIPIFLTPEYDPQWDLTLNTTSEAVKRALEAHPDTKMIFIVYPTYQGVCGDVEAIAFLAHQHEIPLVVDEAHGAHFGFHSSLPASALSLGADLTIQSTHKVLGALTQGSMLHLQGKLIDPESLNKALRLVESTSPNYLLLASLDAARQQMALDGEKLMTKTINLAEKARSELKKIDGLSILEFTENKPGFTALDITRLTVKVTELGLTGFDADQLLHENLGVTAELPMLSHLTFIISLGNSDSDIDRLISGFQQLPRSEAISLPCLLPFSTIPEPIISPREAFFAPTRLVSVVDAIGCISGELICPYPPGIPLIMPGEIITEEAIAYLQQIHSLGGTITGLSDPHLKMLKVIEIS
jgi:arginine decarboxylase